MRIALILVLAAAVAIGTFGCTMSKPYIMEMDRKDQVVDGNRGYIYGTPPPAEDLTGRKRPFMAVDVDLPPSSSESGSYQPQTGSVRTTNVEVTSKTERVTVKTVDRTVSSDQNIK